MKLACVQRKEHSDAITKGWPCQVPIPCLFAAVILWYQTWKATYQWVNWNCKERNGKIGAENEHLERKKVNMNKQNSNRGQEVESAYLNHRHSIQRNAANILRRLVSRKHGRRLNILEPHESGSAWKPNHYPLQTKDSPSTSTLTYWDLETDGQTGTHEEQCKRRLDSNTHNS